MPHRRSTSISTAQPGEFDLPAASVSKTVIVMWFGVSTLLAAGAIGAPLNGPAATIIACAAILIFGLPHGSLDLEIVRKQYGSGTCSMIAVLLLYLGLASAMWAMWLLWPAAALCAFLCVSIVHFSEDWPKLKSAFLAQGTSSALLSAPVWLHSDQLRSIFAALTGSENAVVVADFLLLLAPTSMAVAAVSVLTLWRADHRQSAMVMALALVGMTALPPVIGFACFFCLYHSPLHFAAALNRVAATRHIRSIVVLVTLAALGLAAVLFRTTLQIDLSARFIATSFMTLSLLTLPHMAVPIVVQAMASRRHRLSFHQ